MKCDMKYWNLLLVCAVMPAVASTPNEMVKIYCEQYDDASINEIKLIVGRVDAVVPQIPPEEDRYLRAEQNFLLKRGQSPARGPESWRALTNRPLYYSWQLRERIDPLLNSVDKILDSNPASIYKNLESEKLARAIAALSLWDDYARELQNFLDKDNFVQLDEDTRYRSHSGRYWGARILQGFLRCKLAKIDAK
jgi:hypothetical protein